MPPTGILQRRPPSLTNHRRAVHGSESDDSNEAIQQSDWLLDFRPLHSNPRACQHPEHGCASTSYRGPIPQLELKIPVGQLLPSSCYERALSSHAIIFSRMQLQHFQTRTPYWPIP
ncbi:MAG: hypothetical protein FRX48_01382 [Lasallia pustulata]|uniref:Uncharacterized protein n=1 Tax=Lasallia pustulata TaxID=136370 RepID=A0A5M8PZU3_9LECA|nr:MAG: hypothetical protein FRX48_01382 [Lasallia pustulata]